MTRVPRLSVFSVSAELRPFTNVGGLGDVALSLPKALQKLGHRLTLIMPAHGVISHEEFKITPFLDDFPIYIDDTKTIRAQVFTTRTEEGIPVYLIDGAGLFYRMKTVYGSRQENRRFLFFNLAVLELLKHLQQPIDILQCHDWPTGLIPYYLKHRFKDDPLLSRIATVYTIHNLGFQMGGNWWEVPPERKDDGEHVPPSYDDDGILHLNFAKRAIRHADIINTVSEQYAEEILTPEFGEDLERILRNRQKKLFGIVNGIDYNEFNPKTDPGLHANFDVNELSVKSKNKRALQEHWGLPADEKIPLVCLTSRIVEQKGFDLILAVLPMLMRHDMQMIVLGDGKPEYISELRRIMRRFPKKLAWKPFDRDRETFMYAGSDLSLQPSRFEPCGLTQMKSLRYGCIPIVSAVGGLASTITDYNARTHTGNGFVFRKFDASDMIFAIARAVECYRHQRDWIELVRKSMMQSYSWGLPAKKYVQLFRKALRFHETYEE